MNDKVINVFSFNRPKYLVQVLAGLKQNNLEGWDIVLWQDGVKNKFSNKVKAAPDHIEACVEIFGLSFPTGVIAGGHAHKENWGIDITYMNAKEHTFNQYELALFIEDDLVPSSQYLDILLKIHSQVKDNPKIAQISAYGPDRLVTDKEQEIGVYSFEPAKPQWGYLLSKEQWLRRKDLLTGYWDLTKHCDYDMRNQSAIHEWMTNQGYPIKCASQDTADALAINKSGEVKLTTLTRNATYIGASGLNFTPEQFQAGYYGKDRLWSYGDLEHAQFRIPTDQQLEEMNRNIKANCLI